MEVTIRLCDTTEILNSNVERIPAENENIFTGRIIITIIRHADTVSEGPAVGGNHTKNGVRFCIPECCQMKR